MGNRRVMDPTMQEKMAHMGKDKDIGWLDARLRA